MNPKPASAADQFWAAWKAARRIARGSVQRCPYGQRWWVSPTLTVQAPKLCLCSSTAFSDRITFHVGVDNPDFDGNPVLTWDAHRITVHDLARGGRQLTSGQSVDAAHWRDGAPLYIEALSPGDAKITFTLRETGWDKVVAPGFKEDTVEVFRLDIRHTNDKGPKQYMLQPWARKYKALLYKFSGRPQQADSYHWAPTTVGATLFNITGATGNEMVDLAPVSGNTGQAEIAITCAKSGKSVQAKHTFTVVDVAIKDADRVSNPKKILIKDEKRRYVAVVTPQIDAGQYHWSPQGDTSTLTLEKPVNTEAVDVIGVKDSGPAESRLKLRFTVEDQTSEKETRVTVVDIKVEPQIDAIALDRANGSVRKLNAVVTAPGDVIWRLENNSCEAEIDGSNKEKQLSIKAKKPGATEACVSFTPAGGDESAELKGAAVFVTERITRLTPEKSAAVDIAENASPAAKQVEVLLGLSTDPAEWKTGWVIAEALGQPEYIEVLGLKRESGAHKWIPPGAGFVKLADDQPDNNHGAAKDKVLLRALPNGSTGPPDNPGHTDDDVRVSYTLRAEASDQCKVRVHKYGCASTAWTGGATQPVQNCVHRAPGNEQWGALAGHVTPANAPALRGAAISEPGGHQHGGRCHWCSGGADEHTTATPRVVWHWIPPDTNVLNTTRQLGTAIRDFVLNNNVDPTFQTLLTARLKNYLSRKGVMLGVLSGTKNGATVWRYAVSGKWDADGDWCSPLGGLRKTDTSRTFTGYKGDSVTYEKTRAPFNTASISGGFGKLGRCAAPVLLAAAKQEGITDIRLHETWCDARAHPPVNTFAHNSEIGSCEQCRRMLGAYLCEIGSR